MQHVQVDTPSQTQHVLYTGNWLSTQVKVLP
jgi:hypothetical protein